MVRGRVPNGLSDQTTQPVFVFLENIRHMYKTDNFERKEKELKYVMVIGIKSVREREQFKNGVLLSDKTASWKGAICRER